MLAVRSRAAGLRGLWRRSLATSAAKESKDEHETLQAFRRMLDAQPHVVAARMSPQMLRELKQVMQGVPAALAVERPTSRQLKLLIVHSMIPFIGFGFLDNFTMIMVGEYIDLTLGATLGFSTLAAAGLGNWFSDLIGLGVGGWIGHSTSSLGIPNPNLSEAQHALKITRAAKTFGMTFGVTIGCFLGMTPLLFMGDKDKDKNKEQAARSK